MKNLLLFSLMLLLSLPAFSAVGVTATGKASLSKKEARQLERFERKQARKEARMARLVEKVEKKMEKRGISASDNILENQKFKIGAILGLAGIVLYILAAIISSSAIWIVASIAFLAGVILMIWGLIEYTA